MRNDGYSDAIEQAEDGRNRWWKEVENPLYQLEFSFRRSLRYHSQRKRFFDNLHHLSVFIALFGGSTAWAAILSDHKSYGITFGVIAAAVFSVDTCIGFSRASEVYDNLYKRFYDLCIKLRAKPPSPELLTELQNERDILQKDEPPVFRVLDVTCHNQEAIARGVSSPDKLFHITRWQSLTKQIFSYNNWIPKTLAEAKHPA